MGTNWVWAGHLTIKFVLKLHPKSTSYSITKNLCTHGDIFQHHVPLTQWCIHSCMITLWPKLSSQLLRKPGDCFCVSGRKCLCLSVTQSSIRRFVIVLLSNRKHSYLYCWKGIWRNGNRAEGLATTTQNPCFNKLLFLKIIFHHPQNNQHDHHLLSPFTICHITATVHINVIEQPPCYQ